MMLVSEAYTMMNFYFQCVKATWDLIRTNNTYRSLDMNILYSTKKVHFLPQLSSLSLLVHNSIALP